MNNGRKKILVTGGTGLLGHYLIKQSPDIYDINCTFFPINKKDAIPYDCAKYYLDISDEDIVSCVIGRIKPDYIIHTASVADVDYVENNKAEAKRINLGGTMNILKSCLKNRSTLVYISSNALFDGDNPPYSEDSPANPLNYYGELKLEEENEIKNSGLEYVIVRPILMYGWNLAVERKNPATWLIDILRSGKTVNMVEDIFCNPLFAGDCADAIWKIIALEKRGIFHVGGEDMMSRYEFSQHVANIFGLNKDLIKPVKNSFFKGISRRPKNTTFCIDKIKNELGFFPRGVEEGLKAMKEAVFEA